MKRRNADCGKLRRPIKRTKITEGIYGSTFVYVKFLMVWALVLMADFILEFRFEYLWPFWLLLRSVYDSYKYQGVVFAVFFLSVAVASDVLFYLFVPVQWLFFCASTYVWVQYVWHTDRGLCLPTVSLWLLFVYIEASIRLREIKSFPFNMDLCRPFAAHCIGYPVVTLGFGFKSYVCYRYRLRKQKEIEKENNFYMQLLQQALPIEMQNQEKPKEITNKEDLISNGPNSTTTTTTASSTASNTTGNSTSSHQHQNGSVPSGGKHAEKKPSVVNTSSAHNKNDSLQQHTVSDKADKDLSSSNNSYNSNKHSSKQTNHFHHNSNHIDNYEFIESSLPPKKHNVNDYEHENNVENETNSAKFSKHHNNVGSGTGGGVKNHHHHNHQSSKLNSHSNNSSTNASSSGVTNTANTASHFSNKKGKNINSATVYSNNKEETLVRMELDVKKLKADLQGSRNTEQELRSQINSYSLSEKQIKAEMQQLQQDNESLQTKLHNLVTSRQQDKQNLSALEKKLAEERKGKATLEQQLASERKAKKEEAAKASSRAECTETCKSEKRKLENEIQESRRQSMLWEGQTRQLERETQTLRQYKDAQNESEVLMSALAAMQDKNTHLENSLSAENRLKQDLFSALGEAKRQIEIQKGLLGQKDIEVAELKMRVGEVMSLLPAMSSMTNFPVVVTSNNSAPPPLHFSGTFTPSPPPIAPTSQHMGSFTPPQSSSTPSPPSPSAQQAQAAAAGEEGGAVASSSSLNPNASDYTPKMSQ